MKRSSFILASGIFFPSALHAAGLGSAMGAPFWLIMAGGGFLLLGLLFFLARRRATSELGEWKQVGWNAFSSALVAVGTIGLLYFAMDVTDVIPTYHQLNPNEPKQLPLGASFLLFATPIFLGTWLGALILEIVLVAFIRKRIGQQHPPA